jgi:hypothetical protein
MPSILRTAYVKVEPDTSTFDDNLRRKLRAVNVDSEGDRVGRTFSTALTRRLDTQLKQFKLPTLDLKANPTAALAAIAATSQQLEELRDDADSVELRIQSTKALGDLDRLKKSIGDVGGESAVGFAASLSQRVGPLLAKMPISGPMLAAVGGAAAVAAPFLGSALAGAVIGGGAGLGIVGGFLVASKDARVKAAATELAETFSSTMERAAIAFVPATLRGIDTIRNTINDLEADLRGIFDTAAGYVEPLAQSVRGFITAAVPGFRALVEAAGPIIRELSEGLPRIGDAISDALTDIAGKGNEGASAVRGLLQALESGIRFTGGFIAALADIYRGMLNFAEVTLTVMDNLDVLGLNPGIDKALAKVQSLKAGMNSAGLAAVDYGDKTTTAFQRSAEEAKGADAATAGLAAAQQGLQASLDGLSPRLSRNAQLSDALRQASDSLYGATINQTEANESYEASWDSLSESVKANGKSLDAQSASGRTNRDALQALLRANNELYLANIEQGMSVDEARKAHEKNTAKIRAESGEIGFNRQETNKLIKDYGRIPPRKTTDVILAGLKSVIEGMLNVYLYQRALAEGKTIDQLRGGLGKSAERVKGAAAAAVGKSYGAFAAGGYTGPGGKYEPAGVVHRDEFVVRSEARRNIERQAPGFLDAANTNASLPGYADGGLVHTARRWPFNVDLSESFIMSKAAAAKLVTPAFSGGGETLGFMVRVLKQAFPGLGLISGYRPGSRTLSGGWSYHGLKRAVDYPPSVAMAEWVYNNYKRQTKEFISPFQRYNIHNGQSHTYTGAVWSQHNFAGGNAHNHWAMDRGGTLQPGWNPPIYNGTGRPEPVTPAPTMDAVIAELKAIRAALGYVGSDVGAALHGSSRQQLQLARARGGR